MTVGVQGKRVLVTGGAGFLGSRLVRTLLEKKCKVRVLDIRYGELEDVKARRNLEFVGMGRGGLHGGMADGKLVRSAMNGVEIVYHLAINWDGHSWKHRIPLADLFDVNLRGTVNLLEAASLQKVRHLLFASSAAVYGETFQTLSREGRLAEVSPADEKSVCLPELWEGDPGPAYAILKLATEKLCLMYNHHHGLPVTAFRIEYVFEGQTEFSDYANIHVDDVVAAFLISTLNKKAYGQVFNVAYPSPHISVTKLQRMIGWKPLRTREMLEKFRIKQEKDPSLGRNYDK